jgi:cytochrome c oxidase subunit 3
MAHGEVKHDYHLVNPSPWPLLGSLSVLVLALGGVNFMKGLFGMEKGTVWLLAVGFAMVGWVMIGWWREVIKEGKIGDHTPVVSIGLRYGMILFIASEVMFFVGWFWSFFEFAIYHMAPASAKPGTRPIRCSQTPCPNSATGRRLASKPLTRSTCR